MEKIDYKKKLKHLYGPSAKTVQFVEVPTMNYLMVHGQGEPGGEEYIDAVQALYPVAYTIKFSIKKDDGIDFGVMPLEGLWWAEDMTDYITNRRDRWLWTMMIMQPEVVTQQHVENAIAEVQTKKNPAATDKVKFEPLTEGRCAQILHLGPFSEEGPAIQCVHNAIAEAGSGLTGKHHEIYLSDMRRTAPERLRTILRQPMT